jgi:hypothetical protein
MRLDINLEATGREITGSRGLPEVYQAVPTLPPKAEELEKFFRETTARSLHAVTDEAVVTSVPKQM